MLPSCLIAGGVPSYFELQSLWQEVKDLVFFETPISYVNVPRGSRRPRGEDEETANNQIPQVSLQSNLPKVS